MTEFIFTELNLLESEKAILSKERSRIAAQAAKKAEKYLQAWGEHLFDFEIKAPDTAVGHICATERLRIIRMLRDNDWYKELA